MKHDHRIKDLKNKIKELEKETEFLQRGIESREDAHNIVYDQLNKHMALTQEICFLLLYMEVVQALIREDNTSNARIVKRAINKFKSELTSGFGGNHIITEITQNKLDKNDITP